MATAPSRIERDGDRRLDAELGGRLAHLLVHRLSRIELSLHREEPPVRERGACARANAAALACELERAGQQKLRLVELETNDVRLREDLGGDRLQVLPPCVHRERVRALHVEDDLVHVAAPAADDGSRGQRVEARDRIVFGREDLECAIDELSRPVGVVVPPESRFGEPGECHRLDDGLIELARLLSHLLHLDLNGREVLQPPRRSRRDVASAERRPKLERAESQLSRVRIRLARNRALGGFDERCSSLVRELLGRRAFELGEELDRSVEVVRTDLDELFARALGEPLGEPRVVLRTGELRHTRCTRPRG